jgi:hypothetical protein
VIVEDELPKKCSLAAGTVFYVLSWESQPIDSDAQLVSKIPLEDGLLAILVLEDRLVVEIGSVTIDGEELTDQWITPKLERRSDELVILSLVWSEGKVLSFRLNGLEVPRHSEAETFIVSQKETKSDDTTPQDKAPATLIDLRQRSQGTSIAIKQLTQIALRLENALDTLRSDRPEVIFDIAGFLRTLLCGRAKTGGELIFKCAKEVGVVPVCYTVKGAQVAQDKPPFKDQLAIWLQGSASGLARDTMCVETDLRWWLDQPALYTLHIEVPHWKLIYEVASNFGSHAETDVSHPLFSMMSPHDPAINLGLLVPQFRSYGEMSLEIAKQIISLSRVNNELDL